MAVYVDNAKHRVGRLVCSHMWADDEAELLAMCDTIGFNRMWVQRPGMKKVRWLHCDVSQMMKARAIEAGAIQTDNYGPLEHVSKLTLANPDAPEHAKAQARARINMVAQYRARRKAA